MFYRIEAWDRDTNRKCQFHTVQDSGPAGALGLYAQLLMSQLIRKGYEVRLTGHETRQAAEQDPDKWHMG